MMSMNWPRVEETATVAFPCAVVLLGDRFSALLWRVYFVGYRYRPLTNLGLLAAVDDVGTIDVQSSRDVSY